MTDLVLRQDHDDGVTTITLNRPDKKNALSVAVREQLSDALDAIAVDDDVRVATLTGAGDTFSAGFDLAEFDNHDREFQAELWASSDRFHRTCLTFPLPLIASVNGPALAGGFDLAVMCDLRIASDNAWFAHPELSFTETVYGPLHDLIGGGMARELALTGRGVSPDEALRLGLVNKITDIDHLESETRELACSIATKPRAVLTRMKHKIISRADVALGDTLNL